MTIKEKMLAIYKEAGGEGDHTEITKDLRMYVDGAHLQSNLHADQMYMAYEYKHIKVKSVNQEQLFTENDPYLDEILKLYKEENTTVLVEKIKQWHLDRKITINGNSLTQTVKLGEEYGELCSGIVRKDKDMIADSLGDMFVVMVAIAELEDLDLDECIVSAYLEIKDRKGYLNELGNFIKE